MPRRENPYAGMVDGLAGAEFKDLSAQFPELKRFQGSSIEHKTISMLKDSDNPYPSLYDALRSNGISVCWVHTHEKLVELQKAVQAARDAQSATPEPEPSASQPAPQPDSED